MISYNFLGFYAIELAISSDFMFFILPFSVLSPNCFPLKHCNLTYIEHDDGVLNIFQAVVHVLTLISEIGGDEKFLTSQAT